MVFAASTPGSHFCFMSVNFKRPPTPAPRKSPKPEPHKYFLYVIELLASGHFYVGITKNAAKREKAHYDWIRKCILEMKRQDFIHQRKRKAKPDYVFDYGQKAHHLFAKKISRWVSHIAYPKTIIKWYYSFTVKASCYTLEEAIYLENMYLRNSNPKYSCNIQKTSHYSHGIKQKLWTNFR